MIMQREYLVWSEMGMKKGKARKGIIVVCLIGAVVLMSILTVIMMITSGSGESVVDKEASPRQDEITVNFTGSTYKSVTEKPSGWFTSGQDADIMLSGIDFNNTGGALLFNHPMDIASNGERLLLADTRNNRILIWNSLPTENSEPDIVLGQKDFYSNNPGTGMDQMNWPVSVSTDGKHVAVADTYNNRILIWNTFPDTNGKPADLVIEGVPHDPAQGSNISYIKREIGWPWGVWTNGEKLAVSSTASRTVLIWNSFPTQNNQSADIYLKAQGGFGTPRTITSNGTCLIVGDHNPRVDGVPLPHATTFFWSSFPTTDDQPYDFFMDEPHDPRGGWMKGDFTPDGKLVLFGVRLHIWNSFPSGGSDSPDITVGEGYYFEWGDGSNVKYAGGKLYLCLANGNKIVVFNSLPTSPYAVPDFAIGAPDIHTNTLKTNYIITNPVPVSDGESLFVSSDFDRKLYVWKNLPDESGAWPDIVYSLPFGPWDNVLFGNTLILAGRDTVCIWETLPKAGELPDMWFDGSIGNVFFQDLRGVALDNKYFYLADKTANKIYVWEGIPDNDTNPKFSIDIEGPTRLSSDGTYLVAAATEAAFGERIKFYRIDELSSSAEGTLLTGIHVNLPQAALAVDGHLFIGNTNFNRVLVWSNISDAVNGGSPELVLGEENFDNTAPEIGVDKLFWPAGMTFDGSYLWVGEFKFSGRIVRFSVKAIPREPIYIYGNSDFTSANGVSAGNGTVSNPYIIEGWDISATSGHGIYIEGTDKYFIIRNCYIHDGGSNFHGIYLNTAQNGIITNVTSYNNNYGLYLYYSSNNTITNCSVYNNPYSGIYLYYSSNNQITNCAVYNNSGGICLEWYSSNNKIHYCNIYNNTDYGIWNYNTESQYQVNATYNWWGDASGPYHSVT